MPDPHGYARLLGGTARSEGRSRPSFDDAAASDEARAAWHEGWDRVDSAIAVAMVGLRRAWRNR
jgi:hypothetical protein